MEALEARAAEAEAREDELHGGRVAVEQHLEGQLKQHEEEARRQASELRAESDQRLEKAVSDHAAEVAGLRAELEATAASATESLAGLEHRLEQAELRAREAEEQRDAATTTAASESQQEELRLAQESARRELQEAEAAAVAAVGDAEASAARTIEGLEERLGALEGQLKEAEEARVEEEGNLREALDESAAKRAEVG